MHAPQPAPRARVAVPAVPAHDLLIRDRVQAVAAVHPPQQRMLRTDVLRAPEPVGVPAPQVVANLEEIAPALADRAVVDALVGIVARVGRGLDEAPAAEIELARREHD